MRRLVLNRNLFGNSGGYLDPRQEECLDPLSLYCIAT